jgi:hypothetical protein
LHRPSDRLTVHRLSQRGNRTLNHALHTAVICQLRHPGSDGRVYFDRRLAEGRTKKEALRSLKRHVSNAVYRQLVAEPPAPDADSGPGRTSGNDSKASVTGPTSLTTGSSANSLPDPQPRYDHGTTPSPQRAPTPLEAPPLTQRGLGRGRRWRQRDAAVTACLAVSGAGRPGGPRNLVERVAAS